VFAIAILLSLGISSPAAAADKCRASPEFSLQELKSPAADPDLRSADGQCLARFYLEKPEVAETLLKIIRNPREDLLLREDLIQAFAEAPLRKKVKVEGALAPKLNQQESEAVSRTLASAQGILAVTQAVKSMDETVPVTRFEGDFFRLFSEIAMDDRNHVILRETAVSALEKVSAKAVKSGVYDDRSIRLAQESLRAVAERGDNGSYYSGAADAYERLASAGLPHFAEPQGGRMLSSISQK
jgi:hypothetical protein